MPNYSSPSVASRNTCTVSHGRVIMSMQIYVRNFSCCGHDLQGSVAGFTTTTEHLSASYQNNSAGHFPLLTMIVRMHALLESFGQAKSGYENSNPILQDSLYGGSTMTRGDTPFPGTPIKTLAYSLAEVEFVLFVLRMTLLVPKLPRAIAWRILRAIFRRLLTRNRWT